MNIQNQNGATQELHLNAALLFMVDSSNKRSSFYASLRQIYWQLAHSRLRSNTILVRRWDSEQADLRLPALKGITYTDGNRVASHSGQTSRNAACYPAAASAAALSRQPGPSLAVASSGTIRSLSGVGMPCRRPRRCITPLRISHSSGRPLSRSI